MNLRIFFDKRELIEYKTNKDNRFNRTNPNNTAYRSSREENN